MPIYSQCLLFLDEFLFAGEILNDEYDILPAFREGLRGKVTPHLCAITMRLHNIVCQFFSYATRIRALSFVPLLSVYSSWVIKKTNLDCCENILNCFDNWFRSKVRQFKWKLPKERNMFHNYPTNAYFNEKLRFHINTLLINL